MLKKESYVFIVLILSTFLISCSEPKRKADINNDGGLTFLLEASVPDIIRLNMQPGDTLINSAMLRAQEIKKNSKNSYASIFVQELYKNTDGSEIHLKGLKANPSYSECLQYITKKTEETAEELKEIILKRMDLSGIENPTARIIGNEGHIMVQLPATKPNPRFYKLLQSPGRLEFWETHDNKEIYLILDQINTRLKKIFESSNPKRKQIALVEKIDSTMSLSEQLERGKINHDIFFDSESDSLKKESPLFAYLYPSIIQDGDGNAALAEGPVVGYATIADTALVNGYFQKPEIKLLMTRNLKFLWSFKPFDAEGTTIQLIAVNVKNTNGGAVLGGTIITEARKIKGEESGSPQINLKMTPSAAVIWQNITRDNIGKSIAIVLDGKVYSFPTVQSEIAGGTSTITGNFTEEEATDLATLLSSGQLAVGLSIIEEKVIPPLGK